MKEIWLVYDGECPVCSFSAKIVNIRESVGVLHILNARESHPLVNELKQASVNLDEGFVLKLDNVIYQGSDAMHMLALISTRQNWINRFFVVLFSRPLTAKILYPILKAIRSIILMLKGVSKIQGGNNGNT